MRIGPNRTNRARPPRAAGSFNPRQKRPITNSQRPQQMSPQSAQRNYERYMELARAEASAGNTVGAENYFQYAEHYFRAMSSDK
jgi:Domain of unknown function (DUF4167)